MFSRRRPWSASPSGPRTGGGGRAGLDPVGALPGVGLGRSNRRSKKKPMGTEAGQGRGSVGHTKVTNGLAEGDKGPPRWCSGKESAC